MIIKNFIKDVKNNEGDEEGKLSHSESSSPTSEDNERFSLTELSQKIINLHSEMFQNTPVDEQKQMQSSKNDLLNEFSEKKKLEIKDLIKSKDGHNGDANEFLESGKGFQSMLFLTPPKIHDFKSPSPSPSPLLGIMQSLNEILSTEEEKRKVLDPDLIKLLDGTPVQPQVQVGKKFEAKKGSRNISTLFCKDESKKEEKPKGNDTGNGLRKYGQGQPFYPHNYKWKPASGVINQQEKPILKEENKNTDGKAAQDAYSSPSDPSAGTVRMNPPNYFKNMKGVENNSWKKPQMESSVNVTVKKEFKKIPKRDQSYNSCTSDKENVDLAKKVDRKDPTSGFSFPDGGWVCSFCQNYNFYGRVKCNRCGKFKTKEDGEGKPQHIIRKEIKTKRKNDENNMNNMNKMQKIKMK